MVPAPTCSARAAERLSSLFLFFSPPLLDQVFRWFTVPLLIYLSDERAIVSPPLWPLPRKKGFPRSMGVEHAGLGRKRRRSLPPPLFPPITQLTICAPPFCSSVSLSPYVLLFLLEEWVTQGRNFLNSPPAGDFCPPSPLLIEITHLLFLKRPLFFLAFTSPSLFFPPSPQIVLAPSSRPSITLQP